MKHFKFNHMEWAGAFGDLGTLIPFITAYIALVHFNPVGLFVMLGILLLVTGLVFRTPIPVQPMKAIGIVAASQSQLISQNMVLEAGLVSGVIWLFLAMTGLIGWVALHISLEVVAGIILGVGLSFMGEGLRWMAESLTVGLMLLVLTYFSFVKTQFPVMFGLLLVGFIWMLFGSHDTHSLGTIFHPSFHFPVFKTGFLSLNHLWQVVFILALPQLPLTIGNSCLALAAENNRVFPDRPVSVNKIAWSLAGMNLVSPFFGGMPVCHGVGGFAGQVRFGARGGGAPIILGLMLLILGLFFGDTLARLVLDFPKPVLGVILFVAGGELVFPILKSLQNKTTQALAVLLLTGVLTIWNVGIGLVVGLLLDGFLRKAKT